MTPEKRKQMLSDMEDMFERMSDEEAENALQLVKGAVLGYAARQMETQPA